MSFRLHTGDAIELMRSLPTASIDLLLTDTAYESLEKHRAVGTTTRLKKSDASSNEWFPIFKNDRFEEFFVEAFRVLKKNAHLYFYCDQETMFVAKPVGERAGFKFWKPIVWAKTKQGETPNADDLVVEHQAMGMGYHLRASCEFILFFEKGKRKLTDLGVRDVLPFPTVRNGYPTEKSVELNRVLVRLSSEPGEIVLDPFMGSGSTGVAAVRNGRSFIGGDVKENAVALARKRLIAERATWDPELLARGPEDETKPKKLTIKMPNGQVVKPADRVHVHPSEVLPRCPNEGCQSPACQAMNRCLALEPIPDDDLV
jgi:site-specific DNA-methyltransferase (adenine-specific)